MPNYGDEYLSAASTALAPGRGSLHNRFVELVREYIQHSYYNVVQRRHDDWNRNEREYFAKPDWEEIEQMERRGEATFDDPISLPSTHTFISSHCSGLFQLWRDRKPRFPLRPRTKDKEVEVKKVEALLEWQNQMNRIDKVQLYRYIHAALYGYSPRKTVWDDEAQRNITYFWDPYLFYWDPYYSVTEFQRGKFCGFQSTEHIVGLKSSSLYFNLDRLRKPSDHFLTMFGFGVERSTTWKGGTQRDEIHGITEPESYRTRGIGRTSHIVHEVWWRMIPRDWFRNKHEELYLPDMDPEEPTIAVATIANGETLIRFDYVNSDRLLFPAGVIAPLADGLTIAPPGLAEISSGIQRYVNWLVSSHKEDVQRNINGIWVYDPTRIEANNLQTRVHGMNIPVRKQSYGKIQDAIFQLPVTDVTRNHLSESMQLLQFIERDTGATEAVQGSSVSDSGKRRTATELSILARGAQGRYGMLASLYDQQDSEDQILQMFENTRRFLRKDIELRMTAEIAAIMKVDPKIDTHFTANRDDFENLEIEYIPFDAKEMIFRERSADIKMRIFETLNKFPDFVKRINLWEYFRSIVRDLGDRDFDRFVLSQAGPTEQLALDAGGGMPQMPGKIGSMLPGTALPVAPAMASPFGGSAPMAPTPQNGNPMGELPPPR